MNTPEHVNAHALRDLVGAPTDNHSRPMNIAHRGNRSVTPENTLIAFASALKTGCDGIEMDVVLSADGVPMVIHDTTVNGTTNGSGAVGDLTLVELKQLDAGSWFAPAFAGVTIPTFNEFAQLMAEHKNAEILLEFKEEWQPQDVEKVLAHVTDNRLDAQVMLQSFHPATIASIFTVAPTYRRGVLIEREHDNLIERALAANIYTINPSVEILDNNPSLVADIHAAGMKTQVWTANEPQQWERLTELGVDAIITDRPDALNGWFAGRNL